MEHFLGLFKNLGSTVGRMTPSQVMMFFGVIAGTIVGGFYVVGWYNDVTYSQLYSDLDESEAGEIANYLSENKIPFQLSQSGRTIEVPSSDVYRTRISLASQGLPRTGSIGYSIFDQNNLGMTDFLQNLNFRRALEGELTRTIMQLNEVKSARVHIVMPKERLFKQDKKEATASIVLKLAGENGLGKQQINGITHLVAASVEGLSPGNIVIIDYDGNLLSSGSNSDPVAGLSNNQLDIRMNVESYLEKKAQSMLDGVLGNAVSVVRVTADLDFQQLERTSESYDPNAPSIRSEERTKSSNSLTDKATETAESSEDANDETTITNYELNKTVEHMINAVGGISRLSVAMMVDGSYKEVENDDGEIESIYQPRPQEELDRLAAIVKSAVGFDPQRNDQLEIVNIPFDHQDLQSDRLALDNMYQREFYLDIGKKVGMLLLALFGLFYLKKKSGKLFTALGTLMPQPVPQQVATAGVDRGTNAGVQPIEEEAIHSIEPDKRKPRLVDQMQKTANERPDEIARVIKTMMIE